MASDANHYVMEANHYVMEALNHGTYVIELLTFGLYIKHKIITFAMNPNNIYSV